MSAQARYAKHQREIRTKLASIEILLGTHQANSPDGYHWGKVGDLAYINEELDKIIRFLGNR